MKRKFSLNWTCGEFLTVSTLSWSSSFSRYCPSKRGSLIQTFQNIMEAEKESNRNFTSSVWTTTVYVSELADEGHCAMSNYPCTGVAAKMIILIVGMAGLCYL